MAGPPLSGKTTLARVLVDRLAAETLHVENDELRPLVAAAMDRERPAYDGDENHATYRAAHRLVDRGLERGVHLVHDATNLTEADRRPAYEAADRLGAPVVVAFVQAPREVRARRARQAGPDAERAHAALGNRQPDPSACDRPKLVLDGTRDSERLLQELATAPELDALDRFEPA